MSQKVASTPAERIVVKKLIAGRYNPGKRPVSWDARTDGVEEVETTTGRRIALYSNGGQSTPAPGWQLLLTGAVALPNATNSEARTWTLYGIPSGV